MFEGNRGSRGYEMGVRVPQPPFKYFSCPYCGEIVQPVECGWRLGKMKCPVCRKKCYRETFVSNCPIGCLRVYDEVGL